MSQNHFFQIYSCLKNIFLYSCSNFDQHKVQFKSQVKQKLLMANFCAFDDELTFMEIHYLTSLTTFKKEVMKAFVLVTVITTLIDAPIDKASMF